MTKQTITDVSGGTTYYGEADLGRATTDKFWVIRKTVVSGGVTTVYYPIGSSGMPSGKEEFGWDERASLNYSLTDDVTAPTLTTVTIASNNSDTTKAKVGDEVTLTIVSSEYIKNLVVTIAGNSATVTEGVDDLHFTAVYAMASGDAEGVVPFTIDFEDIAGRAGTQVTAVTGGSSVTFDKTRPTASLLYSVDAGSTYTSSVKVKDADTLRIKATFSEALLDSPVVKLAIDNSVLSATNMTKTSTTVYYYDLNVPVGNIATATCSLSVGTDGSGNVVTSAPTANATFGIDNTAPVFTGVSVLSDNADNNLAKSGNVVTAIFTTSETLVANPTVTLGAQAMTFGSLVGSTYTYTRTLNGTETEGDCNVLVTGTDLAGNVTTNTDVGDVTTDFTLPTLSTGTRTNNTTLEVTLSEVCIPSTTTKVNAGGFTVFETGTPATTYAVSSIITGATDDKVVLTVASVAASNVAGVTITYTAGGNGTVADDAGNLLATDAVGVVVAPW